MTDTPTPSVNCQNNKVLVAVIASLLIGSAAGYFIKDQNLLAKPGSTGDAVDTAKVEEIVKKVIADNPDLILQSIQNMQAKKQQEQQAKASEGVKNSKNELFNDEKSPTAGAKEGINVALFFDYHCGYCKKVAPVFKQLLEEHSDVKVSFKEFPILSPDSREAAKAALAVSALKPEAYFEFHQLLLNHQGAYDAAALEGFADKVGISAADLKKEMAAEWVEAELKSVADLAGKIGVQGTPAIIVEEQLVPGAVDYPALNGMIENAKKAAK